MSREELARLTFNVFDRKQKGHISTSDLRHIFMTLKQSFSDQEINEILLEADSDQDGRVNFKDFFTMMNN